MVTEVAIATALATVLARAWFDLAPWFRAWRKGRILAVKGCARCGHDHKRLAFLPFEQPIVNEVFEHHVPMYFSDTGHVIVGSGLKTITWAWWARCPRTGDPVLLAEVSP